MIDAEFAGFPMVATAQTQLSLDQFLAMPETKPASEYVDGIVTQKPMPQLKHSRIQSRLCREIDQFAEDRKIALALTELKCTFGGRSLVPDIAVVYWDNLPRDDDGELSNRFDQPPNWSIEILSLGQAATKVMEKLIFCINHGTELGWLIDPQNRSVSTFQPDQLPKIYLGDSPNQDPLITSPAFREWELYATDIFNWLQV